MSLENSNNNLKLTNVVAKAVYTEHFNEQGFFVTNEVFGQPSRDYSTSKRRLSEFKAVHNYT